MYRHELKNASLVSSSNVGVITSITSCTTETLLSTRSTNLQQLELKTKRTSSVCELQKVELAGLRLDSDRNRFRNNLTQSSHALISVRITGGLHSDKTVRKHCQLQNKQVTAAKFARHLSQCVRDTGLPLNCSRSHTSHTHSCTSIYRHTHVSTRTCTRTHKTSANTSRQLIVV
jgi:hypothetical protein